MKSNTDRDTPHHSEPTAQCNLARIEGENCLTLITPCCNRIALHAPPFDSGMRRYSRRTCAACGEPYWITLAALPVGMKPATYIRQTKVQAHKKRRPA